MTNLTNDEITDIWEAMPGQPGGWLKEFGYIQFARAIEAEVASRCRAQGGATSLKGLTRWTERDGMGGGRAWMEATFDGEYVKFADVECLLASSAVEQAEPGYLHNAIMNIHCDRDEASFPNVACHACYKEGHREARHAAAELVIATQAAPASPEQVQEDFEVEGIKPTGDEQYDAGNFLLNAARKFWDACHYVGQYGAVQWLLGDDGALLIYTRGEYRDQLMSNIHMLPSTKERNFIQTAIDAAHSAAAPAAPEQDDVRDTALLDALDAWIKQNEAAGYHNFVFAFDTESTAREQIAADDAIRALMKTATNEGDES